MTNPLLQKTEAATLAKADKRLRPVIEKIVAAGKKVMYSDGTRQMMMDQLKQGVDPENIGAGIAKLMGVLFNQSKNTIPMQAGIPAATILLCEALQFIEDSGKAKVDENLLAESAKAMGSAILQMFGVTPERLQGMMGKAQAAAQPAPEQPAAPGGIVQGAM